MAEPGGGHIITPAEQQQLYARAIKMTDWSAKALTQTGEDLRRSAPHFSGVAEHLTATGAQMAAVAEALRGR